MKYLRTALLRRSASSTMLVLALCLGFGGVLSERVGQDANYDLANYHLYDGAALLHGWSYRDLLGSGTQSYLNPVLDAVYAYLALDLLANRPRTLAGVMGLWAGLAAFLAWRLARRLYPGQPLIAVVAAGLGVSGTAFISEVGTTFNDLQTAVILLAALLMLVRPFPRASTYVVAGGLVGIALGLKLTTAAYLPATFLAIIVLARGKDLVKSCVFAGVGVAGGWCVTDGWWAFLLWRRFGNPFFPLFNGVFRSPWYPPANFTDRRFIPNGLLQALDFPVRWFLQNPVAAGEFAQRDPRFALVLVLGIVTALTMVLRRRPSLHRGQCAMIAFLVVGYVAWLPTSGILRYAIILEIMSGLCIPLLLAQLVPKRALGTTLAAIVILAAGTTRYASWGRVPYERQVIRAETDWVQPGSLIVVTLRTPISYLIPLLPFQGQISVVGVDFATLDSRGYRLADEVSRRIREHDGPIAVLTGGDPVGRFAELGEVGLDPMLAGCRSVSSTFNAPQTIEVCKGERLDLPPMPSLFWQQAASRYGTVMQPGRTTGPLIGSAYLRSAGPSARGTHFIDWTDLLWRGVGGRIDLVPERLDPATLYVLSPDYVTEMAARMDPALDALGSVDGVVVLAPGWKGCKACTAPVAPLPLMTPQQP